MKIYLIGSLKNPKLPWLGNDLRKLGFDVFDDWHGAGPDADTCWRKYELTRGRHYAEALRGEAAENIFNFDLRHLESANVVILLLPAGKSGHLEFGFALGREKRGYVLFDTVPDTWDLMYKFADEVFFHPDALFAALAKEEEDALR
jgi:hypothetical protein